MQDSRQNTNPVWPAAAVDETDQMELMPKDRTYIHRLIIFTARVYFVLNARLCVVERAFVLCFERALILGLFLNAIYRF